MKRLIALMLMGAFLLSGCQGASTVPVYKTPNGTPFILPGDYETVEDAPKVTVLNGEAITDELREEYYQFPITWNTRYFADFNYAEGILPSADALKFYSAKIDDYWLIWDLDGETATIDGDKINAPIAQRFDYSPYEAEEQVSYTPAECQKKIYQYGKGYIPAQVLTEYRSVEYGDYTVISVKAKDYYRSISHKIEDPLSFLLEQPALLEKPDLQVEYTYMIKEGGEPIFLSYQMTILWDIIAAYK